MSSRTTLFIFAVLIFSTLTASAQSTPGDLQDLVGERASNGESELKNRGYRYIKTSKGGGGSYTNWWRSSDSSCITVLTYDGRYSSIVKVGPADCNKSSSGTWNSGGQWGNSGGWSNNSDRQISPPSWARGNFYATGPRGEHIQLTINNNGSVIAYVNGGQSYGSFVSGNYLSINGARSQVTRNGNGVTTISSGNGERIVYSRNSWGTGGNSNDNGWGGGSYGGGQISPPSWARGNFYGTGPRGERITLTINSNGTVSADVNGGVSYGSFINGNMIRINSSTSRVSKNGNGITTTSTDNGERINYSRSGWAGDWNNQGWNNSSSNSGSNAGFTDVRYLSGMDARSGEQQLQNLGFANVGGQKSGSSSYTYWYNYGSGQCLMATTRNGKYSSVQNTSRSNCRQ